MRNWTNQTRRIGDTGRSARAELLSGCPALLYPSIDQSPVLVYCCRKTSASHTTPVYQSYTIRISPYISFPIRPAHSSPAHTSYSTACGTPQFYSNTIDHNDHPSCTLRRRPNLPGHHHPTHHTSKSLTSIGIIFYNKKEKGRRGVIGSDRVIYLNIHTSHIHTANYAP